MIRVRHLIGKEKLLSWIDREDIVKIHIRTKANRKLINPDICEIYAFYGLPNGIDMLHTVLGSCRKAIEDDNKNKKLKGSDHAFLNGIQSLKGDGFISKSKFIRLIEIQDRYKINLSINKVFKELAQNIKLLA